MMSFGGASQTDSSNPMKIDNWEVNSTIDIHNILYKFLRITGVPIHYHATQFNCYIRNWLIRDQFKWSIATSELRGHSFEATIVSLMRGGLECHDLQAIQNELNNWPARTGSSQKRGQQRRRRSQGGSSQSPRPGPSGRKKCRFLKFYLVNLPTNMSAN